GAGGRAALVRSGAATRPTHHVLDMAGGDAEVSKHVIVHLAQFGDGVTNRQFDFDRPLQAREQLDDSHRKEGNSHGHVRLPWVDWGRVGMKQRAGASSMMKGAR